jgi:hypothetical protein
MYQEREVSEYVRRPRVSWMRWAIILLTTSWGSLAAGEEHAVGGSGEAPPRNPFLTLARHWCKTGLVSGPIATVVKNRTQWLGRASRLRIARVPDSKDVGAFVAIVLLF